MSDGVEPDATAAGAAESAAQGKPSAAAAVQQTSTSRDKTSLQWLRQTFMLRGLVFMLDHPVAAIRAVPASLFGYRLAWFIGVVAAYIVFLPVVLIFRAILRTGWTAFTWHHIFAGYGFGVLAVVLGLALGCLIAAFGVMIRVWSKMGNSMAVMLGFVLLAFFAADSWRAAGEIPWWRLITLFVIFSLIGFLVLFRQACGVVRDISNKQISIDGVAGSVKDPIVKKMVEGTRELPCPEIPRRALMNLRFIAAILLGRRIFLSGIVVAATLFLLGVIVIGQQGTLSLMNLNTNSVTGIGFTDTFGIGGYQFFLSESLLKVSLLLGVIAAAYFVFANPNPDQSQDTVVPNFVNRMIVLWVCERDLSKIANSPSLPEAGPGGTPTLLISAEQMYQADVELAARRVKLLDAAHEAESQLRQAQARRAPKAEIRRLAEDLDAALTAAMLAAYAAQRAEIGPRVYEDRIYWRKAKATPRVHALTAEAELLLTLRETHRLNGIPAVTFEPGPPPSPVTKA